jgi:hypothetical protein
LEGSVLKILRYVEKTAEQGITYVEPWSGKTEVMVNKANVQPGKEWGEMEGFADASLGDDPESRASRVGTAVMVNGAFVCGKSRKLKRVQISSTGAEPHALSTCGHELVALRNQLRELGHDPGDATVLHGDNQASIMTANCPGAHRSQLRHLELHAFAIRDLVKEGEVKLCWIPTDENPSDILTKALEKGKFEKFSAWLLGDRRKIEMSKVFFMQRSGGGGRDTGLASGGEKEEGPSW